MPVGLQHAQGSGWKQRRRGKWMEAKEDIQDRRTCKTARTATEASKATNRVQARECKQGRASKQTKRYNEEIQGGNRRRRYK